MNNEKNPQIENNILKINEHEVPLMANYNDVKSVLKKTIPELDNFINYWFSAELNTMSLFNKIETIKNSEKTFGNYSIEDCMKAINIYDEDNIVICLNEKINDFNGVIKNQALNILANKLDLKDEDIDRIKKLQNNNEDLSSENKNLIKMRNILEAEMYIEKYLNDEILKVPATKRTM